MKTLFSCPPPPAQSIVTIFFSREPDTQWLWTKPEPDTSSPDHCADCGDLLNMEEPLFEAGKGRHRCKKCNVKKHGGHS